MKKLTLKKRKLQLDRQNVVVLTDPRELQLIVGGMSAGCHGSEGRCSHHPTC
jgi:hypothetical protein